MQNSDQIWQLVDNHRPEFEALADRIWEIPEIAYTEYRSVAEHTVMLKGLGFRVKENLAGIPTAVMGEAGEGGPIIAILGEYDALPGLGQVAGLAERKEVVRGGHGPGGGHTWSAPGAPACRGRGGEGRSLATPRLRFQFPGPASHAAAAPHLGRSALDAVEL